jgi:hypothetical protein
MPLKEKSSRGDKKGITETSVAFFVFGVILLMICLANANIVYAEENVSEGKEPTMSIMYGGDTIEEAYDLIWGKSYWETFGTTFSGPNDWYYTHTSSKGILTFELTDMGGGDLNLYVYDYTGDNPLNKSIKSGTSNEKCTIMKDNTNDWGFYIKVYTYDDGIDNEAWANVKTSTQSIECYSNSDCGEYEKCVDYQCIQKTCSEMGYNYGTCTSSELNSLKCYSTNTKLQCKQLGSAYCWMSLGNCLSDEYCSNGQCIKYECMSNSDCNTGKKCVSHNCVTKTCSDYSNTAGSCTFTGNTYCEGGLTGHPYECKQLELIKCYQKIDTCTSDEYCEDPWGSAGAQCFPYSCAINSVSWDKASAFIGDNVGITVQGEHCKSGDLVTLKVYEDDLGIKDNQASSNPLSKYFSSNPAKTSWVSEYHNDISGDPEYKVYAYYDGNEYGSSNLLTVSCPNNDGDSYSSYGGVCGLKDCNDNNKNIYPGATEICNSWDDDCDGQVDEGFDLQNDESNCGSCGKSCLSGYTCASGVCRGCGDGNCDTGLGENPNTCPNDCYGNLTIVEITSAPASVKEGELVTITAKIENKGTYAKTLSLEAGIAPDEWKSMGIFSSGLLGIQSTTPIVKCCPGNEYYSAKNITLGAKTSESVTFNLYAPKPTSIDACNNGQTAWGNSHTLVVGIYEKCGSGYVSELTRDIKVYKICRSYSECPAGEYCDFNSGFPGICKPKICQNLCGITGSYLCSGNEIVQCADTNADTCLELSHIAYCTGSDSCVAGKSTCQQTTPKTQMKIDYSDGKTQVNKQPGDILTLRLNYGGTETITLTYDNTAFTLFNCSNSFTITSDKACQFSVNDAPENTYNIGIANGQKSAVGIIKNPKTIIITDRKKLIERFGDSQEVDAMLAEAYRTALNENGVVYELGDYLTNNLWNSPTQYEGGKYAVR